VQMSTESARGYCDPSSRIWELMDKHAKAYVSPEARFPVPEAPKPGFIVRYSIVRIGGIGPWVPRAAP
jgi:hypothetical protein